MKNKTENFNDINDLEWEIKYCERSMEEIRFERTQDEIDNSKLYQNYKQKKKDAIKKIEILRS